MSESSEVFMPSMGEGVTEATLVKWLKEVGQEIREEEPLLEVSTDKVDTEIPAPASGTLLEVRAQAGATIQVDDVIALIGSAESAAAATSGSRAAVARSGQTKVDDDPSQVQPRLAPKAEIASGASASGQVQTNRRSSPLVRKMAAAMGADLNKVTGTGLAGRITRRDLEAYLQSRDSENTESPAPSLVATVNRSVEAVASARLATKVQDGEETLEGVKVRREPMSTMRRKIAEHMVRSVRTSPHVTTTFEIDCHAIVAVRERFRDDFQAQNGFKLTFTPIFLHAAVQAIKRHPIVNCSVDGEDILMKDSINIGCAVALPHGLIVPVIREAQNLNLRGIASSLNDLVQRARTKKLKPEDVQGGTFSVTNPGMFGSIASNPIINQPQVAILNLGAIVKRPMVVDDMIGIRPMINIGLTFDHRVVDGEGGARYLADLKEILESYSENPF